MSGFTETYTLYILILGLCGLPHPALLQGSFNFGWVTTKATTTNIYYAPNPGYDAYWQGGQWVFGTTMSTAAPDFRTRFLQKQRMLVCGRPCGRIYRKLIGQVCVHKLDNVYDPKYDGAWQGSRIRGLIDFRNGGQLDRNYDYLRTFDSYCQFLDSQCRVNVFHGYGYVFLHMGKCLRDEDAFPNIMYGNDITVRKQQALAGFNYEMSNLKQGKKISYVLLRIFWICITYLTLVFSDW